MSEWIEIELPYPPSVNHYWRHTRNGRHYISERGRAFKALVAKRCAAFEPIKGAVAVWFEVTYPDNRRRDPDNLLKVLLDGLTDSGLIEDDNQQVVQDLRMRTAGVAKGGQVVMKIRGLNGC